MQAPTFPPTELDPVLEIARRERYVEPADGDLDALRPDHERVATDIFTMTTEFGVQPQSRFGLTVTRLVEYVDSDEAISYIYAESDIVSETISLSVLVRNSQARLSDFVLYTVDDKLIVRNAFGRVASQREINRLGGVVGRMKEDLKKRAEAQTD